MGQGLIPTDARNVMIISYHPTRGKFGALSNGSSTISSSRARSTSPFTSSFSMTPSSKTNASPSTTSHRRALTCWACPTTSRRSWRLTPKKRDFPASERGVTKNVSDWEISCRPEIWSVELFHTAREETEHGRRGTRRTRVGRKELKTALDGVEMEQIDCLACWLGCVIMI